MGSLGDRLRREAKSEGRIAETFEEIRADLLLDDDQSPMHFVIKHVVLIYPTSAVSHADQYPFLLGLSFNDEYAKEVIIIYAPGRGAISYSVGAIQELYGDTVVELIRAGSKD
jgi:hypothetical protein